MTDSSVPATKADIDVLRGEMDAVRNEMDAFRIEVRTHYATKADLAQMEARLTKWMIGLMVGAIAVASTLALMVERLIAG